MPPAFDDPSLVDAEIGDEDEQEYEEDDEYDMLDLEDLEEMQQSKVATPTCCAVSALIALLVGCVCFGLSLASYLIGGEVDKDRGREFLPLVMVALGGIPVLASAFLFSFALMIWCANRNEYARVKTMIEMQKKEALV